MNPTPIRPIYDMPGHKHYGPVRRAWTMLEQLFADRGGMRPIELQIAAEREVRGFAPLRWDTHLASLLDSGVSEPAAQRTVIQQLFVAEEFLR
jgi:hypothetical protein